MKFKKLDKLVRFFFVPIYLTIYNSVIYDKMIVTILYTVIIIIAIM